MRQDIKTIRLALPFNFGSVNCYLIETDTGYCLIDTGISNRRSELERELERTGCKPGSLKLIVITHGDFDHTGNAAYLRNMFGTKIAMHAGDSGMAERGDMFWNRKKPNILIKVFAPMLFRLNKSDRFTPDFYLDDGDDLSEYGFDGKVLSIPGHSKGSIGILLMASGDLFGGDLFENTSKPALSSIMDDQVAANGSVEKIKSLQINTIYPGHGEPFPMDLLIQH